MISLNKICIYLVMIGLALLVPSIQFLTFTDELISFALLCVAATDCLFNNNWRKYKLLWIIIGVMAIYAIYSLTLDYNTLRYIILDFVIEIKPFLPFCVLLAIGPEFTESDKRIIKAICIFNVMICFLCFIAGTTVVKAVMYHPTYPSQIAVLSGLFYYYCSVDPDSGFISQKKLWTAIAIMAIGILGGRSKIYATFIIAVYFLAFYRPGILRHLTLRHFVAIMILLASIVVVSWQKFNYYFLQGDSDSFDPTVIESFARPVLYVTGFLILLDHFPFGSGLASFATYASSENYSGIYYEYGINNVYGLGPNHPYFICDAFLPSLAQFGIVGFILFIYFWIYVYQYLRILIRDNDKLYRAQFTMGSIIIIFLLIESTSGNTFTQTTGMIAMCMLGICCANGSFLMSTRKMIESKVQNKLRKI